MNKPITDAITFSLKKLGYKMTKVTNSIFMYQSVAYCTAYKTLPKYVLQVYRRTIISLLPLLI